MTRITRRRRLGGTAVLIAAMALAVPAAALTVPSAGAAAPAASSSEGHRPGAPSAARAALSAAERLATPASARAGERDASMTLHQLRRSYPALSASEKQRADALFKRPTDAGGDGSLAYSVPEATPLCDGDLCVHYVTSSSDAISTADTDSSGRPDYAERALSTLRRIHDTYIAAGYREPRADGSLGGGSNLIDIYLGNVGDQGIYGYCTSDKPYPGDNGPWDAWAYCVLDNDFSPSEFGTANTPTENLDVTAAHEYFHATQYAYDSYEDPWILEATATWAEDEMYDSVDDNLQYLRTSPLTQPTRPLDSFGDDGFQYGAWIFIRYLTERFRTKKGALPVIVRDLFLRLDGAAGGPDDYSWKGLDKVLQKRGISAATAFVQFSATNRRARTAYAEGRANDYPETPLAGKVTLTPRRPGVRPAKIRLDHLTSATFRLSPKGFTDKRAKLRLVIKGPVRATSPQALVTVYGKSGKPKVYKIRLNGKGDATPRVPFSSRKVRYVEVTLANASGRFQCGAGDNTEFYSCFGLSRDDGQRFELSATALKRG